MQNGVQLGGGKWAPCSAGNSVVYASNARSIPRRRPVVWRRNITLCAICVRLIAEVSLAISAHAQLCSARQYAVVSMCRRQVCRGCSTCAG